MKDSIKSSLRFENYIVDRAEFKNNAGYDPSKDVDGVEVNFDIDADYDLSEDNKQMLVFLRVSVFPNAEKNNYPFEMNVDLVGFFSMNLDKDEDITKYYTNAVAILFPYLRALVSSYTANANVTPLVLPAINVNKLIEKKRVSNKI